MSRSKDLEMRQNRDKEGVLSDYEEGGSAHAFGSAAATFLRAGEVSGNSEAVHKKGKKNSRIAGALRTSSSEGDIKTKVPVSDRGYGSLKKDWAVVSVNNQCHQVRLQKKKSGLCWAAIYSERRPSPPPKLRVSEEARDSEFVTGMTPVEKMILLPY